MSEHDDTLWDPNLKGDAELQRLQTLLAPYSAKSRGLDEWTPSQTSQKKQYPRFAKIIFAGLAASLLLYVGHIYRLSWNEGQPWQVTAQANSDNATAIFSPGSMLETGKQQSLTIDVARIGQITLSPKSKLRLITTRSNKHRVSLETGHMRAKIWAPPGYFGIANGDAELIDLGCDFDLWKKSDGSGRVYVRSGWVAYEIAEHEVLVPAGFEMKFDAQRPFTPIRPETTPDFANAVHTLERTITASGTTSNESLAASAVVAEAAQDADAFTLLSLLTQHPYLAKGALYPRLAQALKTSGNDEKHRTAWIAGNIHAINDWWDLMPSHPKNWWSNWTDALP